MELPMRLLLSALCLSLLAIPAANAAADKKAPPVAKPAAPAAPVAAAPAGPKPFATIKDGDATWTVMPSYAPMADMQQCSASRSAPLAMGAAPGQGLSIGISRTHGGLAPAMPGPDGKPVPAAPNDKLNISLSTMSAPEKSGAGFSIGGDAAPAKVTSKMFNRSVTIEVADMAALR
jgi:hypothetical protein